MLKRYLRHLIWLIPVIGLTYRLLDQFVWLSPEEEVRRFVERGERAMEALSILRCERFLAEEFSTESGMSRGTFLYYARTQFSRLEELQVDVEWRGLTLSEDEMEAEAILSVGLTGKDKDGTTWRGVAEGRRTQLVTLDVRKRDGDWKLYSLNDEWAR